LKRWACPLEHGPGDNDNLLSLIFRLANNAGQPRNRLLKVLTEGGKADRFCGLISLNETKTIKA
jgi:hypothetical protein